MSVEAAKSEYQLTKDNLIDEINFVELEVQRKAMSINDAMDAIVYRFDRVHRAYTKYSEVINVASYIELESRYNFWCGYVYRAKHHLRNVLRDRMEPHDRDKRRE